MTPEQLREVIKGDARKSLELDFYNGTNLTTQYVAFVRSLRADMLRQLAYYDLIVEVYEEAVENPRTYGR